MLIVKGTLLVQMSLPQCYLMTIINPPTPLSVLSYISDHHYPVPSYQSKHSYPEVDTYDMIHDDDDDDDDNDDDDDDDDDDDKAYVPTQSSTRPLPVNPSLQKHLNDPGILTH